jgi:hypothetical protein
MLVDLGGAGVCSYGVLVSEDVNNEAVVSELAEKGSIRLEFDGSCAASNDFFGGVGVEEVCQDVGFDESHGIAAPSSYKVGDGHLLARLEYGVGVEHFPAEGHCGYGGEGGLADWVSVSVGMRSEGRRKRENLRAFQ